MRVQRGYISPVEERGAGGMGKKLIVSIAFLVCGAFAYADTFDPSELNKITFKNSTSKKIMEIFLSPSDSDEWGPDIIGADYHLGVGDQISYYVHYPESSCDFDILAIDEAENAFEVYNFTITDGKAATVNFTSKNLRTQKDEFDYITLTINNETDYEIDYLFISPSDSDAWGVDYMDASDTLSSGDSYAVVIPHTGSKVKYNFMAVDEDNDVYKFDLTVDPKKGSTQSVAIENSDLE
jgi:hypothetical protein